MPGNTSIFLIGLAVGTVLVIVGVLIGYWLGRRASSEVVDKQQFVDFLREMAEWSNRFSGDVSKFQDQLNAVSEHVEGEGAAPKEKMMDLLSKIMEVNDQLQGRLDNAEEELDTKSSQISNYLNEARTDVLTQLPNRRAFDKEADELFEKWMAKDQAFSLALIDIDHFKKINDTYGHLAGDKVLQEVGSFLTQLLGSSVCVARYGGEEFALLTLESLDETADMLEALRQFVEQQQIEHEDQIISITLSAGAAQIQHDEKIGKLIRRADEALYAAKLGGRNRVYVHDGTICRLITEVASADEQTPHAEQTKKQARIDARLRRIVEEESRRVIEQ